MRAPFLLPGSISSPLPSPHVDTRSSFHDTIHTIDSPVSLVERFIEGEGSKPINLEKMAQSIAEDSNPADTEIAAISTLILMVNVKFNSPALYQSLLPSALDFIAIIHPQIWRSDILHLNGIVNSSNHGANDLLFALINRIDTSEAEMASGAGATPESCLNKKDKHGRCPFSAAAEQHDYRTAIKMIESGKMTGLDLGNPLINFMKYLMEELKVDSSNFSASRSCITALANVETPILPSIIMALSQEKIQTNRDGKKMEKLSEIVAEYIARPEVNKESLLTQLEQFKLINPQLISLVASQSKTLMSAFQYDTLHIERVKSMTTYGTPQLAATGNFAGAGTGAGAPANDAIEASAASVAPTLLSISSEAAPTLTFTETPPPIMQPDTTLNIQIPVKNNCCVIL